MPIPAFRQVGQATIEYLYVLPILLLLLLASMQLVFIYEAKQTLNYATFMATRAGALNNGAMAAIQDGLAAGLAPLFAHDTRTADAKENTPNSQQVLKDARATAKAETTDSNLALIEILNPTADALSQFGNAKGEIPNDNLMYRKADEIKAGMNVQDANLLKVRVTYCVRLVVPLVNRMISGFTVNAAGIAVAPTARSARIDTYTDGSIAAAEMLKVEAPVAATGLCNHPTNAYPYRIPVTSEAVVRMQSPFRDPGNWTAPKAAS